MSRRRTAAAMAALATLSGLLLATPAAQAGAAVPTAVSTPCVHPTTRTTPKWRTGHEPAVTTADLAALPASETTRASVAREVAGTLPATITIPVWLHVISGHRKGERPRIGPYKARRLVAILNSGYSGAQSSLSAPSRYRFVLHKIDYRKRESWYHAYFFGPRDKAMKRKLHKGGARSLNIYVNGGGPKGEPVLGWSRFPWQYAATPRLDGISVNVVGLPGGRATGYNLGDTLVHETGHWLGLLHTFQGGCEGGGDLVSDTPAEAEPSYYCETTRDTCPEDPGLDPVHDFMDYSLDACMNMFTAGQVRRMDVAWATWRQHG
jgi:Pregnancy-associated plasma protein-A